MATTGKKRIEREPHDPPAVFHKGDYVIHTVHRIRGRVSDVDFGPCPEGWAWFRAQVPPLPLEYFAGECVHVLVHDGGAVLWPVALLERTEHFELRNDAAVRHWPAEYPALAHAGRGRRNSN